MLRGEDDRCGAYYYNNTLVLRAHMKILLLRLDTRTSSCYYIPEQRADTLHIIIIIIIILLLRYRGAERYSCNGQGRDAIKV